jgi:hypothetical protein
MTSLLPSNVASVAVVLIIQKVLLMTKLLAFAPMMTLSLIPSVILALAGTTLIHQDVAHMMMPISMLPLLAVFVEEVPLLTFQSTLVSQPLPVASTTTLWVIPLVILAPCGTIPTHLDVECMILLPSLPVLSAALAEEVTTMEPLIPLHQPLAHLIFPLLILTETPALGTTCIKVKTVKEPGITNLSHLQLNAAVAEVDHTDLFENKKIIFENSTIRNKIVRHIFFHLKHY